jgi:ATP-dependent helicase HrpB
MSLVSKPNLLLQAAPGAGKTTIVPLQLLLDQLQLAEDDNRQILVVAPRRVAVRSAAQRMTALIGDNAPGGTVGYAMRDEVRVGTSTLIKVVTDGVLLNMLKGDPELNGISIVVLDEFHERGVGSDTSLALLREVQQNFREDDLKIVVMSATLLGNAGEDDNEEVENGSGESENTGSKLMRTLGGSSSCGIVESEGRQYPIQLRWANEVVQIMSKNNNAGGGRNGIPPLGSLLRDRKSLIQTAANVVERAALKEAPERGDVLVFLPGAAECRGVVRELNSRSTVTNIADVYSLYGAMPKEDQDEVLYPSRPQKGNANDGSARRQRVIVSTPIAEASLTIPSVTCVVDSGLRREPRCDADTGMPRLVSARISKASAIQRMGRAGRVREGSCLRLYTETDFEKDFEEQSPPEIASTDLAPILLLLADWGVSTLAEILHEMPFVDPPEEQSLERAERFLVDIGALEKIDSNRFKLTELGRKISKMPCHPRLAACISGAMNRDDEDPTVLAASIAAAFCLDDESSVQRGGNQDDPNLAYTISSLLQTSSKFSSFLRFSGRVGGRRGKAVAQALQANEDDFVRRSIANLGKAMLPGFVDLVGERKGDASYDSSNYFLAVSFFSNVHDWIETTGIVQRNDMML